MKISILFVGAVKDGGFNERALTGVERLREASKDQLTVVDGIPYDPAKMSDALSEAAQLSDGVVFIGGQGNQITPTVAQAFPQCSFAVVQGNIYADNIASYDVLQEQSAFLAGVLAARLSKTGTIGHLSGHRVVPGLKGRAAFVAGARFADANIRVITGFCGTQDDSTIAEAWASAMADQGVDFLFTMLNAARTGATKACRATGMRQIGNATDWCEKDPEVFAASALARIDLGVERAITDMLAGKRPATVQKLGLADEAVGLVYAPDISMALRCHIGLTAAQIAEQKIDVDTQYLGPEFSLETLMTEQEALTQQSGGISIHAVDVANGTPAVGLKVRLRRLSPEPTDIAQGPCAPNGQLVDPVADGQGVVRGTYEVQFDVGDYYRQLGVSLPDPSFVDVAVFRFGIDNVSEHFHLPFKFTPWGFSLFRGGA
jgi:basic membrane protein A